MRASKVDVAAAFLVQAGLVALRDDCCPWFNGSVWVVDHPYFDLTAAAAAGGKKAGEFVLTDVPPGDYTLVCWHEGMEETFFLEDTGIVTYGADVRIERAVHVEAGKTAAIDFVIPAPKPPTESLPPK